MRNEAKIAFVKWVGPHKLFAPFGVNDPTKRRELDDTEAIKLFDKAYHHHNLDELITNAEVCDHEKAYNRIKANHRKFFDKAAMHREFRYLDLDFIAQIQPQSNEVMQIWPVKDHDPDPRMIFIWFETAQAREHFEQIAKRFHYEKGSDLAKDLIDDFIHKVSRKKHDLDDDDIPF
jgi:hypothetical protein